MGEIRVSPIFFYKKMMFLRNSKKEKELKYLEEFKNSIETGSRASLDVEDFISKSPYKSLEYAKKVIKGRFEKGEDAILQIRENERRNGLGWVGFGEKCAKVAYEYAELLNKPFPQAEKVIAGSAKYSYLYALNILNDRFLLGEKILSLGDSVSSNWATKYCIDVVQGPLEELEKSIVSNLRSSIEKKEDFIESRARNCYLYAKNAIKGRFEFGENAISQSAKYSYLYSLNVLNSRFPDGEDNIFCSEYFINYKNVFLLDFGDKNMIYEIKKDLELLKDKI